MPRTSSRAHHLRRRVSHYDRSQLIVHRAHLVSKVRKYQRLIRELDCTIHPEYCYHAHISGRTSLEFGTCRCTEYLDTSSEDE